MQPLSKYGLFYLLNPEIVHYSVFLIWLRRSISNAGILFHGIDDNIALPILQY